MAKGKYGTGKWKYGSISALMLVMVLLAVAALNAGIYALEKNKGWSVDLSFNGVLSQSAETKKVLEKLDTPVEIYALFRRSDEADFSPITEIEELLDKYAASSSLITWKQVDPTLDPMLVEQFTTEKVTPGRNNLIVRCEKTGRFRVVGGENLLSTGFDEETGTFQRSLQNYEGGITNAIDYVIRERIPQAVILQGHGEFTADDLQYFQTLLEKNQYEVVYQDLNDSEYTPDPDDLLIFFCPGRDLNDDELKMLAEFEAKGGSFLFVSDYIDQKNSKPNYETLLRSYGFVPKKGLVVADVNAPDTYFNSRIYNLIPEICSTDVTIGMLAAGNDLVVLAQTTAFEEPEEADRNLDVETVLRSGETSVLKGSDEGDPTGAFPLALRARRVTAEGFVSRAFIIGDSAVLTDETLYTQTDNMNFTVMVMDFLQSTDGSNIQIASKEISRPGLKTGSTSLGSILLIALPLSALFAALLVLGPRKNA